MLRSRSGVMRFDFTISVWALFIAVVSLLIVTIRVSMQVGAMMLKVDEMWGLYKRQYGIRADDDLGRREP